MTKILVHVRDEAQRFQPIYHNPRVIDFSDKLFEQIRKIDSMGRKLKVCEREKKRFSKALEKYIFEFFKDDYPMVERKSFSLNEMTKTFGENYWANENIVLGIRLYSKATDKGKVINVSFIIEENPTEINFSFKQFGEE